MACQRRNVPAVPRRLTRRHFLGAASGLLLTGALTANTLSVIEAAFRTDPGGSGSLAEIDHFVLLMQENRSFDHYFGTLSGVRGFDDMNPSATQPGYDVLDSPDSAGRLAPFHLDATAGSGPDIDVLFDPNHSWSVQHDAWHNGAMDAWLTSHLRSDDPRYAPQVMGYYTRADLPAHFALADAFTVCDHYFSSVIGPTAPNRLYWMTGTLDPDGAGGGPVLGHSKHLPLGSLNWPTFPEVLTQAGITWKVYNGHDKAVQSDLSGMLKFFDAYQNPASELYVRGVAPRLPDFRRDVAAGQLPSVSWLVPTFARSEHPSFSPSPGAEGIAQVLEILIADPAVWERTAVIVSYDENGGFFDHVAPPTAPRHATGEYLTAGNLHGASPHDPIGLGFRVPALVISPHSRGGQILSDVLDHTSQLKMIGRRFGVPVPNLSPWRDATVSDFAAAFQRAPQRRTTSDSASVAHGAGLRYPPPDQPLPRQERSPRRAIVSSGLADGRG